MEYDDQNLLKAIDEIWNGSGENLVQLPKGTTLWHSGVIGPHHPISDNELLWATRSDSRRYDYDGFAREYAKSKQLEPYRLELSLRHTLCCADFNSFSLQNFTVEHCNSDHPTMKAALQTWISSKNLGGVVAINRGPDEVVVRNPKTELQIINMKAISIVP